MAADPLLERIGEALFGHAWALDMGAALGVNERTARRWYTGAAAFPETAWYDLYQLVREREAALMALRHELGRRAAGVGRPAPSDAP
jgi:hypothetical protein